VKGAESSRARGTTSDRILAKTALVLSGGGARGAYQVGALRGLHELLHGQRSLPFPILVGASAGSITNAFLGAHAAAQSDRYPTVADTAGLLLNALFLEALESDVERLERINSTVDLLPRAVVAKHSTLLRRIPILVLRPSTDLGELVMQTLDRLPYLLRHLFRGLGATDKSGWDLLSYLGFDGEYTSRLLALGYSDVMGRGAEIAAFLGSSDAESKPPRR